MPDKKFNVKIEKSMAYKILKISEKKYKHREFKNRTEAARHVLISFVEKNQRFLDDKENQRRSIESKAFSSIA